MPGPVWAGSEVNKTRKIPALRKFIFYCKEMENKEANKLVRLQEVIVLKTKYDRVTGWVVAWHDAEVTW